MSLPTLFKDDKLPNFAVEKFKQDTQPAKISSSKSNGTGFVYVFRFDTDSELST